MEKSEPSVGSSRCESSGLGNSTVALTQLTAHSSNRAPFTAPQGLTPAGRQQILLERTERALLTGPCVANGSDGDLAVRVKGVARTPWKANRPGTFHHLYYLADDGCYKLDVLLGAQRKLAKNKKLGGDHAVKKMFYKCCSCGARFDVTKVDKDYYVEEDPHSEFDKDGKRHSRACLLPMGVFPKAKPITRRTNSALSQPERASSRRQIAPINNGGACSANTAAVFAWPQGARIFQQTSVTQTFFKNVDDCIAYQRAMAPPAIQP